LKCPLTVLYREIAHSSATSCMQTLAVRLYLPASAFRPTIASHSFPTAYSDILGNWYDIYPLPLSSICGVLKAKIEKCYRSSTQAQDMEESAVKQFNADTKDFRAKLSLVSSSGSKSIGGTSTDDITLKGCLQRYAADTLAQNSFVAISTLLQENPDSYLSYDRRSGQLKGHSSYSDKYWVEARAGVTSRHRSRIRDTSDFDNIVLPHEPHGLSHLETFLSAQDAVLAASNLHQGLLKIIMKTSSMNGMLEQLENIGHNSAEYVEGLNVELLGFQKQALQWALDRERIPDGIQSFWWAKLPGCDQDIYFNPILQRFRRGKPKVVKGGFIAQEMGKSVFCLLVSEYS
jgi:hypothetical protein